MAQRRIYQDIKAQWRELKRRQRKSKKPYYAKRDEARQALENPSILALKEAEGIYDVIVIDPPWPVAFQGREARPNQVTLDYATMTLADIQALKLPLADAAHVWLWTTQRFLYEALICLKQWGLTYSCCFVWIKGGGMQPMGLPQMNCEFALYARKGSPLFLDTTAFMTCFEAPRTEHSAKPDAFYAMIRRVTAGRRLDMFNRRPIEGFDGWGYEAQQEE